MFLLDPPMLGPLTPRRNPRASYARPVGPVSYTGSTLTCILQHVTYSLEIFMDAFP